MTVFAIRSDIETHSYVLTQLRNVLTENGITKINYTIHPSISLTSTRQINDSINLTKPPHYYGYETPIYPGCKGTQSEVHICLIESLKQHVTKNFNKDVSKNIGLSSGKKIIHCEIKITKTGSVEILEIKAPHKNLKVEAKRVLQLIPKIIPQKKLGTPVETVQFIPITVNVE